MHSGVYRFACTKCGACCNRSPEVELSEAAALADVFVFRLMFRHYELPRTFADYLASGMTSASSAEQFHQKKRLLSAFAANMHSTRKRLGGKAIDITKYLTISAITVDTSSGTCSALSDGRCSIHERRPLACQTAPFHYSRAEASAERDLSAFVAASDYRCETGPSAPIVLEGGQIIDAGYRKARADALTVVERDRPWHQAIVRRMKSGSVPSLRQVEADAAFGAITISMHVAWQIAADLGIISADECSRLIAAQAAVISRELAAARSNPSARETLSDMRAEYQQLLSR